jgi:hypothetical protein
MHKYIRNTCNILNLKKKMIYDVSSKYMDVSFFCCISSWRVKERERESEKVKTSHVGGHYFEKEKQEEARNTFFFV